MKTRHPHRRLLSLSHGTAPVMLLLLTPWLLWRFSSSPGYALCDKCGDIKYSPYTGSTSCLACPRRSNVPGRQARSIMECLCKSDWYMDVKAGNEAQNNNSSRLATANTTQMCKRCGTGASCVPGVPPYPVPGYWRSQQEKSYIHTYIYIQIM